MLVLLVSLSLFVLDLLVLMVVLHLVVLFGLIGLLLKLGFAVEGGIIQKFLYLRYLGMVVG